MVQILTKKLSQWVRHITRSPGLVFIGPMICIGREIQCLPHAGFFLPPSSSKQGEGGRRTKEGSSVQCCKIFYIVFQLRVNSVVECSWPAIGHTCAATEKSEDEWGEEKIPKKRILELLFLLSIEQIQGKSSTLTVQITWSEKGLSHLYLSSRSSLGLQRLWWNTT